MDCLQHSKNNGATSVIREQGATHEQASTDWRLRVSISTHLTMVKPLVSIRNSSICSIAEEAR